VSDLLQVYLCFTSAWSLHPTEVGVWCCMVGRVLMASHSTVVFCMSAGLLLEPLVVTSIALLCKGILQWLRLRAVALPLIFDCCWWMLLCGSCGPCFCTSAVNKNFQASCAHRIEGPEFCYSTLSFVFLDALEVGFDSESRWH